MNLDEKKNQLDKNYLPMLGFILVLSGAMLEVFESNSIGFACFIVGVGIVTQTLMYVILTHKPKGVT